jgi:transcription antitermination factor NusG
MSSMEFQVGQTVRVTQENNFLGDVGKVQEVHEDGWLEVSLPSVGKLVPFLCEDVELVEEAPGTSGDGRQTTR